ncbi:MAG: InlB B-repeat-containing protein [Anaerolineales bacterium]|nr:InlB B-repeat-containing protein [Anaerolineales bacterium]
MGGSGYVQIGSDQTVISGNGTASVSWTGLDAAKNYEWYAEITDTLKTATPPSRSFTTASATNYTATFNGNGSDNGSMNPQTASVATNLTSNGFTRTGYSFVDWTTAANGSGTHYANGASYPFTSSVTLYAQWAAVSQTLTFDSNGGSAVGAINQPFGSAVSAPTVPTKTGYTFGGWYNEVSLTTLHTFDTMGLSTTLYAKWTANSYTITFDSNGGSVVAAITQPFGSAVSAPTAPTKTGYTFGGWYSDAGLTTPTPSHHAG